MLLSFWNLDDDERLHSVITSDLSNLFSSESGCTLNSDNDKWNLLLVYSMFQVGQEEENTNLNVFTFLI